jgi:capsular exopolysaccharide synthesis family protein
VLGMLEVKENTANAGGLCLYKSKNATVSDAFNRLMAGLFLYKKNNGYRTFTVTGCERGVGSTSVAINLAITLAISGCKTVLVDMDMSKSSFHKRLSQAAQPGLTHYLEGIIPIESTICRTTHEKLDYIAFGQKPDNAVELLCSGRFDDFMSFIAAGYDYVIFDSPSINAAVDADFLALKTDAVILIAKHNKTKLSIINNALRELEHVGANLIGIVLNNVNKEEYRKYLKDFKYHETKHRKAKGSAMPEAASRILSSK